MTSLVAQRFLGLCHGEYLSTNLEAKLPVIIFFFLKNKHSKFDDLFLMTSGCQESTA